jgi:hypothetical protein
MARGIADGKKDRLLGPSRGGKGLVPPCIPINGIVGVLKQIRALLRSKTIGHLPIISAYPAPEIAFWPISTITFEANSSQSMVVITNAAGVVTSTTTYTNTAAQVCK